MEAEAQPKKRGRKPKSDEVAQTLSVPSFRDDKGLVANITHEYDEQGFVDWRKMVNKKHVALNRHSAAKAGVDVNALTDEEKQKYLDTWPDEKKVILLAGFKELARLRGYYFVNNIVTQENEKVVCHCTISWLPNWESPNGVTYTSVASAAPSNVAPDFVPFLEAVACNRAFSRAVRESLNIHVVSDAELNPTEEVKIATPFKLVERLRDKCKEANIAFDTVIAGLAGQGLMNAGWVSWETLPMEAATVAFDLFDAKN
jgi:hypothetical protein